MQRFCRELCANPAAPFCKSGSLNMLKPFAVDPPVTHVGKPSLTLMVGTAGSQAPAKSEGLEPHGSTRHLPMSTVVNVAFPVLTCWVGSRHTAFDSILACLRTWAQAFTARHFRRPGPRPFQWPRPWRAHGVLERPRGPSISFTGVVICWK